jgi:hypothetical protein
MKKACMFLLAITVSVFAMAQEKTKQKEVGLIFRNLDNFGVIYKSGSEKALWRYNALMISGSSQKNDAEVYSDEQSKIGFSAGFGREYRKEIAENFELRYGADLSFAYNHSTFDHKDDNGIDLEREQTTYSSGVNLIFGFNYVFKEKFVVGFELLPAFSYYTGKSVQKDGHGTTDDEINSDISGFNYGLSNSSAVLSVAYRFFK